MRSLVVMVMLAASLASAEYNGYTESRDLRLPADGISVFDLDTGAGSLTIKGDTGADEIVVKAVIRINTDDVEKAQELIADDMQLTLTQKKGRATLNAEFNSKFWGGHTEGMIDLEVHIPSGIELKIDDGSGSLDVSGVAADLRIDDGSGSISVSSVGNVRIDDGSGSIEVHDAGGDVSIDDGSGSIKIVGVSGSVKIDDGSGSIDVSDVEHDLTIVDDGSGGLTISNVRGTVTKDDS